MTKTGSCDVLVVGADELTRAGVRQVLAVHRDIRVIGEAGSATDALAVLRRRRPAVALLDGQLADDSAIGLSRRVRELALPTRILILSDIPNEQHVRRAIASGARGYLLKSASGAELRAAILEVASGRMTFSDAVAASVRALMSPPAEGGSTTSGTPDRLTRREHQVLRQLEHGRRNREIAEALGISNKTVESHVRNVLIKLGVNTRTQAVARALRTEQPVAQVE